MTPPNLYDGPVAFVQGVHYPVDAKSGDSDLGRPLRWDSESGKYRDAEPGEPLHNDVHHAQELTPDIGSGG